MALVALIFVLAIAFLVFMALSAKRHFIALGILETILLSLGLVDRWVGGIVYSNLLKDVLLLGFLLGSIGSLFKKR